VPSGFRHSYVVPVPKVRVHRSRKMTCDDFRGIAINPIIFKVFEYCTLDRFKQHFSSGSSQFGFKKGFGCRNAVYKVRSVVKRTNSVGRTANICAIDLTKAFDNVNHCAL